MNSNDTPAYIQDCISGDEFAIERLISQYQTGVFRIALSVLDDPGEANEAAQDTFIAALAGLNSYQDRSSFKAWLYTIALNVSRSRLRKKKTLERLRNTLEIIFQVQSQKPHSPEDVVIQNEKSDSLWKAMGKLGEKHRIPLVLRYFHDLSVAEIAEILRINEGTVHSRLHTAREQLRVELEEQTKFTGE
jgi:RNA polymerase sigma-70 factor (ECF subfamily)